MQQQERREKKRFNMKDLKLDAVFGWGKEPNIIKDKGTCLNMSSNGVFFRCTYMPEPGTNGYCEMAWPVRLDEGERLKLRLKIKVVRVEKNHGIAAIILQYEFVTLSSAGLSPHNPKFAHLRHMKAKIPRNHVVSRHIM